MAPRIAFAALLAVLAIAAVRDVTTHRVPSLLTLPAILLALVAWTLHGLFTAGVHGAASAFLASLAAALLGLVPFYLIARNGFIGGGDAKLMGALGAISASWETVLGTAFYALLLALLFGVVIVVRKRLVLRTLGRLWHAFLLTTAKVKPEIPDDSPKLPFALCIALGGALAAAENLLGYKLLAAYL